MQFHESAKMCLGFFWFSYWNCAEKITEPVMKLPTGLYTQYLHAVKWNRAIMSSTKTMCVLCTNRTRPLPLMSTGRINILQTVMSDLAGRPLSAYQLCGVRDDEHTTARLRDNTQVMSAMWSRCHVVIHQIKKY